MSFDDAAYLQANPDLAGRLTTTPWSHYVRLGYKEGRPGVPREWADLVQHVRGLDYPTPPPRLMARVQGNPESESFVRVGQQIALDLRRAAAKAGAQVAGARVLDFGCGCGRVTLPFAKSAYAEQIVATDIDSQTVGWARISVGSDLAHWMVNDAMPPLPYRDGEFDLVYSISVFTHLPEDMQHAWLAELARVTKPGGLLLLTVCGDHLIRPHLRGEALERLNRKGFYYHPYGSTEGLPEFYQAAWHTAGYIRREWSRHFEVREVIPRGIADHQDLVIARR